MRKKNKPLLDYLAKQNDIKFGMKNFVVKKLMKKKKNGHLFAKRPQLLDIKESRFYIHKHTESKLIGCNTYYTYQIKLSFLF